MGLWLSPSGIMPWDPNKKNVVGVDWTRRLAGTGDTPASCQVSILTGSCELADALAGTYGSESSATIAGNITGVAVKNATLGTLRLLWRMTSSQGRIEDKETLFSVDNR